METFQTINDFLDKPFGEKEEKSKDFERKFSELDSNRKIKVVGLTQVEDDYLLHLTIGSKTNPTESYDVVLLFFTDDDSIKKEITFKNYYVKFFSNSPSFIYQYADKIIEGRIRKFFEETVLVEQTFIKDSSLTIKAYLEQNNAKLISLVKYEVGEGMEKRNDDFAAEVMSQIK